MLWMDKHPDQGEHGLLDAKNSSKVIGQLKAQERSSNWMPGEKKIRAFTGSVIKRTFSHSLPAHDD